uniref:Uncharacterized protein n=1 Tax=Parascaris equorum TaxID=6256 RepID=A0A914R5P3_PAREQ
MPKDETLAYSVRNVDAAGRVWIRQGATCPWSKGWMHLDKRTLFYVLDNCAMLFELDVRKFIAMKTEVAKVDWCASVAVKVSICSRTSLHPSLPVFKCADASLFIITEAVRIVAVYSVFVVVVWVAASEYVLLTVVGNLHEVIFAKKNLHYR